MLPPLLRTTVCVSAKTAAVSWALLGPVVPLIPSPLLSPSSCLSGEMGSGKMSRLDECSVYIARTNISPSASV